MLPVWNSNLEKSLKVLNSGEDAACERKDPKANFDTEMAYRKPPVISYKSYRMPPVTS